MSSDAILTTLNSPPLRRPYQVITRVDKDTLRIIQRKRGPQKKRSQSEAAYLLLRAGIEADEAASQPPPAEPVGEDRRVGDRRSA